MTTLHCDLEDTDNDVATKGKLTIALFDNLVGIRFEGYEVPGMENGFGSHVVIEYTNGAPRIVLFASKDTEQPSHVIDLGHMRIKDAPNGERSKVQTPEASI